MRRKEQIIEKIERVNWYHSFEVQPGIITPGKHFVDACQVFDNRFALPSNLTGLSALDIGALDGPYSFELERRGAKVIALDIQDPDRTGFNTAKQIRQSNVQYIQGNVYDLSKLLDEKFDIVTFFGVWYHLKNPVAAFHQLSGVVENSGLLLLEGECLLNYAELEDGKEYQDSELLEAIVTSGLPVSLFYSGVFKSDKWTWQIPSLACIKEWLLSSGFELVFYNYWNDHPHQRLYGTAKKSMNPSTSVDNPIW